MTELKTLKNSSGQDTQNNVSDVQFWGNKDSFKLISKAWSKNEGWMKSTKVMEVPMLGCLIQVTTQQGDNVAEALQFVPGAVVVEISDDNGKVTSRSITISKRGRDVQDKMMNEMGL